MLMTKTIELGDSKIARFSFTRIKDSVLVM